MSNDFKLLSVEPTQEMLDAITTERKKGNGALQCWYAAFGAAPQPPALGGEPDILGKVVSFGEGLKEISWAKGKMPEFGVELIDRAHLAPLKAEYASLLGEHEDLLEKFNNLSAEQDQIKARCDELQILLACRDDDMKSVSVEFDGLAQLLRCALPFVQARCDETDHGDASARTTREGILSMLKRLYPSKPAGSERVCHLCRGEGRVGGPAPDEGGGKNCGLCDGTGMEVQS